jgi:NAD(P)-dependent dehydrogenase (short-subunit alcohol dehydrogenase family)
MTEKIIVITGSTRGIGYGLAESFLRLGCSIVVSGRSMETTERAVENLNAKYGKPRIFGIPCDVTDPEQVIDLWDGTIDRFGKVDIWINNAGYSGEMGMVWERPPKEVDSVIATNLLGTIYGAQVAFRGMQAQGFGAIYNMEGMGSDGRMHAGLTFYGTTKSAVHYFTKSFAMEAKETPIIVGGLRPGMVATDLLRDRYKDRPEDWERARKIFNIIAERIETVTPWLAEKILNNTKNDIILSYSSSWKLLWKFVSSPFMKRQVFDES